MANEPTVVTTALEVVRIYTHNGIHIPIKIDFRKKEISIVNEDPSNSGYQAKQWAFQRRGLEYMQGWQDIFEALAICTRFAAIELQQYVDEEKRKEKEFEKALLGED